MEVPGATGYFDTDYGAKARYALEGLRQKDFVFVHVEAPDEAGHMGDERIKMEAIEAFDAKIVGAILKGMERYPRFRMLVLPDHPTPVSIRTHGSDPVPFVLYAGGGGKPEHTAKRFDEESARESGFFVEEGYRLIERLFM
jgi:2,3-bisphosphoglycerate-independent phosphoglycerate mutase